MLIQFLETTCFRRGYMYLKVLGHSIFNVQLLYMQTQLPPECCLSIIFHASLLITIKIPHSIVNVEELDRNKAEAKKKKKLQRAVVRVGHRRLLFH